MTTQHLKKSLTIDGVTTTATIIMTPSKDSFNVEYFCDFDDRSKIMTEMRNITDLNVAYLGTIDNILMNITKGYLEQKNVQNNCVDLLTANGYR